MHVRDFTDGDRDEVVRIAAEHALHGEDSVLNPRYVELLQRRGRFLVSEDAGQVVGFGAMVRIPTAAMVSELFVATAQHGRGIGTSMLNALVGSRKTVMTFSSSHPAARAAYQRLGLRSGWTLRYFEGPIAHQHSALRATRVDPSEFVIDRPELLGVFDSVACMHISRARIRVGSAIVADPDGEPVIHRLLIADEHDQAILAVMNNLPAGATLRTRVPDCSSAAATLRDAGFVETDHDLYMGTAPDLLPRSLAAVNPGLA